MGKSFVSDRRARVLGYTECYVLFLAVFVLSLANFFWWRGTVELLLSSLIQRKMIDEMAGPFYLAVLMLLVGGALFALVLMAEPYLRDGVSRGQTRRRFRRLVVPLVVAFILAFLIRTVM